MIIKGYFRGFRLPRSRVLGTPLFRWTCSQFGLSMYFYCATLSFPPSIIAIRDVRDGWSIKIAREFCEALNARALA